MASTIAPEDWQIAEALSTRRLQLIILPTEQCNFRCTYCYEDFSIGRMKKSVADALLQFIEKRAPDLDHLAIDWFGGEPLLAHSLITEIMGSVANLSTTLPSLQYSSEVTTNGYLLSPKLLKNLVALGVTRFQISLDGEKAVHDQSRVRATGAGSFDKIWENLIYMRDSGLQFGVTLRLHVTASTYESVQRLILCINDEFGGDRRFNIFLKAVEALGGDNDDSLDLLDPRSKRSKLSEMEKLIDSSLKMNSSSKGCYVCYASKANSFVVRSDGSINKCTVGLRDPRNDVGKLLPDGNLLLNPKLMKVWMGGLAKRDASLLGCPYHFFPKATAR